MAHQKTLTDWILANQNGLNIHVKKCTWIDKVFPGWFDLDVSITVNGQRYNGRGSSDNPDTALSKAFCEAVERNVCANNGIRSHGVAGHYLPESAKENARLEYIERRTVVSHVRNNLQLKRISGIERIQNYYRSQNIMVDFYELSAPSGASVVFCLANGLNREKPFGGVLGLGSHGDVRQALEKAAVECLRNLEVQLVELAPSITSEQFKSIKSPTGPQKQALLRDTTYFQELMNSFTIESRTADEIRGEWKPLEIGAAILKGCPLYFFKFHSNDNESLELDFVG